MSGNDLGFLAMAYVFVSMLLLVSRFVDRRIYLLDLTECEQYWTGNVVYNVYFHPLAKLPGALCWRASRLFVVDVKKLHEYYGDVVRTAPDEVSFAHENAWNDIFSNRPGHKPFPRDPTFFKSPPGQPDNLITTIDTNENARMRQVVMSAFTERSFVKQEATIQSYNRTALLMVPKREQPLTSSTGSIGTHST